MILVGTDLDVQETPDGIQVPIELFDDSMHAGCTLTGFYARPASSLTHELDPFDA
jgi:hypothetical protein